MTILRHKGIFLLLICCLLLSLNRCDCGGGGTTQVGNPSPDPTPTVTATKISEDDTTILYISLGIIGDDENDLPETTIDTFVNGDPYSSDLNALENYDAENERVVLEVNNVNEGDVIKVIIHKSDDTFETYIATASSTTEATAILRDSGTDDEATEPEPEIDPNNAVTQITDAMCAEITACISYITDSLCQYGFLLIDNLTDNFGVSGTSSDMTLGELQTAVEAGTYTANEAALDQCISDIGDITCTEISAQYSYLDPTNFDNLQNLIPNEATSCPGVF